MQIYPRVLVKSGCLCLRLLCCRITQGWLHPSIKCKSIQTSPLDSVPWGLGLVTAHYLLGLGNPSITVISLCPAHTCVNSPFVKPSMNFLAWICHMLPAGTLILLYISVLCIWGWCYWEWPLFVRRQKDRCMSIVSMLHFDGCLREKQSHRGIPINICA